MRERSRSSTGLAAPSHRSRIIRCVTPLQNPFPGGSGDFVLDDRKASTASKPCPAAGVFPKQLYEDPAAVQVGFRGRFEFLLVVLRIPCLGQDTQSGLG